MVGNCGVGLQGKINVDAFWKHKRLAESFQTMGDSRKALEHVDSAREALDSVSFSRANHMHFLSACAHMYANTQDQTRR